MNQRKLKRAMALYGGHANRSWYSFKQLAADEVELMIYDEIGVWGIGAKDFVADLKGVSAKTLHVRLNSPGGDVFDGLAILNALREHPAKVKVTVDALAASIASIIMLAGDERQMANNAYVMIHNPWSFAIGDADEMRKMAEVLDKITDTLVKEYANSTGHTQRQVREWMDNETWFDADEAVKNGFATAKIEPSTVEAAFDLTVFQNAPKGFGAKGDEPPTERELEAALRDAGLSKSKAAALVTAGKHVLRGEPEEQRGDPALAGVLSALKARDDLMRR